MSKDKKEKKPKPRKWNRRNKPNWMKRKEKADRLSPPSESWFD